jgi:hypothetical protein
MASAKPPFVNSNGTSRPPEQSSTKPADFSDTAQATGSAPNTGGRNFLKENRKQGSGGDPSTTQNPPPFSGAPHLVNRPQQAPTDGTGRVDESTLPSNSGGRVLPPPAPPANTRGTGSVGNPFRGFRVK